MIPDEREKTLQLMQKLFTYMKIEESGKEQQL